VTDRKCILFVDDDPSVLIGLKNLLRRDRNRWDLLFASDGVEALELVRTERVDVIVSDMRMPHMDGATLLNAVKERSPATARIMLSGFAEPEAIARALPALHQLLVKPCASASLRTTIERSLAATSASMAPIGSVDRVPSPAATIAALAAVLASPAATIGDAAAIICEDPGLAAKVLQLANSAFFSSGGSTTSIERAVSMIGIEQLRRLHAAASIFELVGSEAAAPWLQGLQREARRGACLARAMFRDDPAVADQVYTAALLRDVGLLVLAMDDPEYREVITRSEREFHALERARGGVTHAELGGWLLSLWGLPTTITELVRFHDQPELAPEALRPLATAIHAAAQAAAASA